MVEHQNASTTGQPGAVYRTERLLLRVSPDEKALIARNADELGLSLSAFLRAAGMGQRVSARRPAANDEAIRQLAMIGNNINQIARRANSGNTVDGSALNEALTALLDAVRRLE